MTRALLSTLCAVALTLGEVDRDAIARTQLRAFLALDLAFVPEQ